VPLALIIVDTVPGGGAFGFPAAFAGDPESMTTAPAIGFCVTLSSTTPLIAPLGSTGATAC
jgi:hypothetical protein